MSEADRQKCADILGGDNSSLMPCYTTVDVAPFQRMCISDAAKQSGTGGTKSSQIQVSLKCLLLTEAKFTVALYKNYATYVSYI